MEDFEIIIEYERPKLYDLKSELSDFIIFNDDQPKTINYSYNDNNSNADCQEYQDNSVQVVPQADAVFFADENQECENVENVEKKSKRPATPFAARKSRRIYKKNILSTLENNSPQDVKRAVTVAVTEQEQQIVEKRAEKTKQHSRQRSCKRKKECRVKCPECDNTLASTSTLRVHIICKHTPENQIKWQECEFCSRKFKVKSYLEKHKAFRHKIFCNCGHNCLN